MDEGASTRPRGARPPVIDTTTLDAYWALPVDDVALRLGAATTGLSSGDAGRRLRTFGANALLITMSANLGNMGSMALASLALPFLPFLPAPRRPDPAQQLSVRCAGDGLALDSVDPELVDRPRRWDIGFIGRFMVVFGLISSAFDFLTFAVLPQVLHASPNLFRTAWFVESLLTELAIALVVARADLSSGAVLARSCWAQPRCLPC